MSAGDLCLFKTVDDEEKYIIGRVIQFSYLRGSKREREYSSNYCDISKQSHNNIGTFANWYVAVHPSDTTENVFFKPIMLYTAGYVFFKPIMLYTAGYVFFKPIMLYTAGYVFFKPIMLYTAGYAAMSNYVANR